MAIDRAKKDEEIDIEEVLAELEHKVERVKILYEQYFMGIEKLEPQTARKEVSRKLIEIQQMNLRNTVMRYRFHALNQKFSVYTTYWNRTAREIENGTYYRTIARANREAARRGVDVPDEILRTLPERMRERIIKDRERIAASVAAKEAAAQPSAPSATSAPAGASMSVPVSTSVPPPTPAPGEPSFDETFDALFSSMTGSTMNPLAAAGGGAPRPSPPAMVPPQPRPSSLPPGMDEERVRELHRQYVQAQLATGQKATVRYEQIRATVIKQGTKIVDDMKAKGVDFNVVLRDGKVILKATPKR